MAVHPHTAGAGGSFEVSGTNRLNLAGVLNDPACCATARSRTRVTWNWRAWCCATTSAHCTGSELGGTLAVIAFQPTKYKGRPVFSSVGGQSRDELTSAALIGNVAVSQPVD